MFNIFCIAYNDTNKERQEDEKKEKQTRTGRQRNR